MMMCHTEKKWEPGENAPFVGKRENDWKKNLILVESSLPTVLSLATPVSSIHD